jgi:hypothetical protein
MPTAMHVIRAEEFIRLNAEGKLDLVETHRVLARVAAALVQRQITHAVLDVRHAVAPDLSATDLYELADTFEGAGFQRSHRLAIVYPPGPGEKSHFFSLCASNRGWQVAAFEDWGEAVNWLFRAEDVGPETGSGNSESPDESQSR